MPELPEVETCVRYLKKHVETQTILSFGFLRTHLRYPIPHTLSNLSNQVIKEIYRKGKHIVFRITNSSYDFVIHLGMSGRLRVESTNHLKHVRHDHFKIFLSNNQTLIFQDPRRFGYIRLIADHQKYLDNIGLCALNELTLPSFYTLLQKTHRPLKTLLLDQTQISGLGNIYVCEALFQARISPFCSAHTLSYQEAQTLYHAIQDVLHKALNAGGSSIRDFSHVDQTLGYFQNYFSVYGREKSGCPTSGCAQRITRVQQAGRSTFFCPHCQKAALSEPL